MTAALIIGSKSRDVMIYLDVCRVVKEMPTLITSNGQWVVAFGMPLISFYFCRNPTQFVPPVGSGM